MESLIKALAPFLTPLDLSLMVIIGWREFSSWKREKVIAAAFASKDDKLVGLFTVLNTHTDAIQRLLGFLDGQRRSS